MKDDFRTEPLSRRLDPERRKDGALKELAGRIQSLSYRDMARLAELIDKAGSYATAEKLLKVADQLSEGAA
jgi:predicted trehalose synthase